MIIIIFRILNFVFEALSYILVIKIFV